MVRLKRVAKGEGEMKTDAYTKVVLTIIAIALSALAVENAIPKAIAQGPTEVRIVSVAGYAFQYAGPIAVRVQQ
jgi:hypothetical protein